MESTSIFSAHYCKEHFDSKGHRYRKALEIAPQARIFELLPMLLFLNDRLRQNASSMTMADVLCGSGFLSSRLASLFERTYGVDTSSAMLATYPKGPEVSALRAELNDGVGLKQLEIPADVICCLVGLHHVYMRSNGGVDQRASTDAQVTMLSRWAESIPKRGMMLIADVTDPSVDLSYSKSPTVLGQGFAEVGNLFGTLWAEVTRDLSGSASARYPDNLADYVSDVSRIALAGRLPQPASWFRDVVDKRGLYGHEDCFPNPTTIVTGLRRAGFSIDFYELPTPWVFDSENQFLLFFHEIFGFGPSVDTVRDITDDARSLILQAAERHLGIVRHDSGAVVVGWRLGYYVVVPCR